MFMIAGIGYLLQMVVSKTHVDRMETVLLLRIRKDTHVLVSMATAAQTVIFVSISDLNKQMMLALML